MPVSLATYQFDAELGAVDRNLRKIEGILAELTPGEIDIIAFPEMSDTGYAMDVIGKRAVTWSADHLAGIRARAAEKRTNVLLGVSERVGDEVYNAVVVIDRKGTPVYKYRKSHLVTIAPLHEERTVTPGDTLGRFDLDGIRCGVMTCYELRFPEIARTLTLRGIQLLFVPTAWPLVRRDHLVTLTRARAIENQIFVVLAARTGTDAGAVFSGHSMIVSPTGEVLTSGGETGEELLRAVADLQDIDVARGQIAALSERRPDLYT